MEDSLERMYSIDQVVEITGLSRPSIYRLLKDPVTPFPRPCLAGRRASRWFESELKAWQEKKRADRDAGVDS